MIAVRPFALQKMDALNRKANEFGMKINVKKTKAMVVSKNEVKTVNIVVDEKSVEQVERFKYLGSLISQDGRCITDVKSRIAMAKEAFNRRKELLTKRMNIELKKKIVTTVVWPVALYGCETWTLTKEECRRLEAFEIWVWRRMQKVDWKERKTNDIRRKIGLGMSR